MYKKNTPGAEILKMHQLLHEAVHVHMRTGLKHVVEYT